MTATLSHSTTTYKLQCPKCKGSSIRKNVCGDMLYRVAVDPETGDVKSGMSYDFIPSGPVDLYQCLDCDYENVCNVMFVTEA